MTAIYPGSFDPFTNGHLNVLNHAADIFDKVYVVVMKHPNKQRLINLATSKELICKSIPDYFDNSLFFSLVQVYIMSIMICFHI